MAIDDPIFISFYTNNGKYPEKKKILERSLKRFDLEHELVEVKLVFESWIDAVFYKSNFIFDSLLKHRKSVVWLDIDNEIWKYPSLFFKEHDFAIYNWYADRNHHLKDKINYDPNSKKLLCSGGVQKFGYTAPSIHLLLHWIKLLKNKNHLNLNGDDQYLDLAFNNGKYDLNTLWLPKNYIRMDKHSKFWSDIPKEEVVINNDYTPFDHGDDREKSKIRKKGF